jgi:hypothetical protein
MQARPSFIPWTAPTSTQSVLCFVLGVICIWPRRPAHTFADMFTNHGLKISAAKFDTVSGALASDSMSPSEFETAFGPGTSTSDYRFVKNVYEFTPDEMHYWSLSSAVHARDTALLVVKSIMPTKAAESGIFRIQTPEFQGFQQGNPEAHENGLQVGLYSNDGGVEIHFMQHGAPDPVFVTQPEINRIIQSLHRVAPAATSVSGQS